MSIDLITKGPEAIKYKMDEINSLGNNMTQKDKGLLTALETFDYHGCL